MLYISRRVILSESPREEVLYGVVDTDDGHETIVSEQKLSQIVNTIGLDINGVDERSYGLIIHPYQPSDTISRVQVKTKAIKCIDVKVYNGVIVDIFWKVGDLPESTRLRLSDFGDRLGDVILYSKEIETGPMVTLVFDDKLSEVSDNAFNNVIFGQWLPLISPGWLDYGIKFDLCELTKKSIAENLYSQITRFAKDSRFAIVDDEYRKSKMLKKYRPVEE